MLTNGNIKIKEITYLSEAELDKICSYLQGAIYTWCVIKGSEEFAAKDLVGGVNFEWEDTPLYALYKHYEYIGESSEIAIEKAGQDLGCLLKKTIHNDARNFSQDKSDGYRQFYKWEQ